MGAYVSSTGEYTTPLSTPKEYLAYYKRVKGLAERFGGAPHDAPSPAMALS